MNRLQFIAAVLIALSSLSLTGGTKTIQPTRDQQFLVRASQASESEIAFGKLADAKSATDSVRNMAAETVKEHQAAKYDLKILFTKMNMKSSGQMDPEHLMKFDAIRKLNGRPFDIFYLNEQNLDHQQLTILYQIEIVEGKDPLVIEYARKHLPVLKTHLKMFHLATNGLIASTVDERYK